MDTSLIESKFLKENQLLGLGFPHQGYIFMRCLYAEEIMYTGYSESPGSIAANTFEETAKLPINTFSIDNLLRVEDCDHIYQVFLGWKPGSVRQYLYYPNDMARRNLDVKTIYSKSPFGYVEGFQSEYDRPSPATELFIPKDLEVGFAWWNPLSESVDVRTNILIRRMTIDIIRDVELVNRILTGSQPCRLTTMGGSKGTVGYNAKQLLDVDYVNLGSSREEIAAAVS